MKKYIWLFLGVIVTVPVFAQQVPLYSQYTINPFLYNPARTGERGSLNANLIYRKMWSDIPGAPETRAITLDGSLVDKKVGLGGYLYQDNTGIVQRFAGYLSYAYHIRLKEDMHLSVGLAAGAVQTKIDQQAAKVGDNVVDPVLSYGAGVAFDASLGINYDWKGLNVGFAVPQLFQSKTIGLIDHKNLQYQLARHYLLNASYEIPIKNKFYIEPAVMFRSIEGKSYQMDIGSSFSYKRFVWLNLMYRYDYAVTVGAGIRLHDRFSIGYAYDIAVNGLKNQGGGTHEIFVGIRFGKKQDDGIIEAVKQLQQHQKEQDTRIDTLEKKTTELDKKSQEFKEMNDKLQKDLNDKTKNIEDLEKQLRDIVTKVAQQDSARTNSKHADLPADLIYRGKKEDLDFIKGTPESNYFLVISSVRTVEMAQKLSKAFDEKGSKTGIVYNKRRTWYYIYLDKPGNLQEGIKELYRVRKETQFKDAWIHIYE